MAAETTGVYVDQYGEGLSYLPGQRLSACTCPSFKDHPGPKRADGSWKGRAVPELDIFEAGAGFTRGSTGRASMSVQTAPFNTHYDIPSVPGVFEILDNDIAQLNSYTGDVYQQAVSGLVTIDHGAFERSAARPEKFGFEYVTRAGADPHITWMAEGRPAWRMNQQALGPDALTEIGQRLIPEEPMHVIIDLGLSKGFIYSGCFASLWTDRH